MMNRRLTLTAAGLLVLSSIVLSGCSPKAQTPGSNPGTNPPATQPGAPSTSAPGTTDASLQDLLPSSQSYKAMDGTPIVWKVTRDGNQVRVEETAGNAKVSYHYILEIKDGSLVQTKFGNSNGVEFDRQRTWFVLPPKSFTNLYSTEDSGVKEEATEEWTNSKELGRTLHVHLTRTIGQSQLTVDEFYKPGVGLFSRTVKDKSGTVVDKLDLVPAK